MLSIMNEVDPLFFRFAHAYFQQSVEEDLIICDSVGN